MKGNITFAFFLSALLSYYFDIFLRFNQGEILLIIGPIFIFIIFVPIFFGISFLLDLAIKNYAKIYIRKCLNIL